MKCLLVLLAALFVTGCSVGVTHQTEDENHTEKSSAVERSRTTVAVGLLSEPASHHESKAPNANQSQSSEPSRTIVKVIVPEPSPEVVNSPPAATVTRSPDQSIRVAGPQNTIVFGDVHLHHHEHVHVHQAPKPTPVRINVRVEDRVSERERTRRMVEARIARVFPHYRD